MVALALRELRQEFASSLTHAVGAFLSAAGAAFLITMAFRYGTPWHVFSFTVFGLSMTWLYLVSALMHAARNRELKRLLGILDQAAIFLFIAGSYTPFTLVTMRGKWGWALFTTIWALALAGSAGVVWWTARFRAFATPIYLAMGWMIVLAVKPLVAALPVGGLVLLVLGGLSYSFGVIFFLWTRYLHHHAIWHLFVMAGSILHFLVMWRYVLPYRP